MIDRSNEAMETSAGVYVQTNDAAGNELIAFRRSAEGKLSPLGRYQTGGRGTGEPHLASQNSVVLTRDARRLLVVNAGSDDVSLFAVDGDALRLTARVGSGGRRPTSIAAHARFVYVLNSGGEGAKPSLHGFTLDATQLISLRDSTRELASEDADPAQISFSPDGRTLVVTERGTNSISTYVVDERGYAAGPNQIESSGATPYGFDFADTGALVVTEAFGGEVGAAAASSYALRGAGQLTPVSTSVADTRSEVCWAAVTRDGRFAYVTNFGDGTISSYRIESDGSIELLEPVAASTRLGVKGIRDEALTRDGRYLYALDADAQKIYGWVVGEDGQLAPLGDFDGLPPTVAGLAAS
jgi:6-phosphogluconolactonase (cycloisomerase 2 family)